jgi:hypothetical protein
MFEGKSSPFSYGVTYIVPVNWAGSRSPGSDSDKKIQVVDVSTGRLVATATCLPVPVPCQWWARGALHKKFPTSWKLDDSELELET